LESNRHGSGTPQLGFANRSKRSLFSSENRKWWILFAIGMGTFMTALDISVVNTVLPVINSDFGSSIATVEWVIIIYLLLVSGLLPIFGRLGDLKGQKPVYLSGFSIFIFSSVLCSVAPSIYALIASRGLQSLGAAMLSANSPAIITKSFPDHQRGQALGLQATMTYLGLSVGPSLGGWLTEQYSWRAVFLINLPVGIIAFILSAILILKDVLTGDNEGFDFIGAILLMAGLVSLLLGLNQGHNWGWGSWSTILSVGLSWILLRTFIFHESHIPAPMLDLSLFKSKIFSASMTSAVLNYICVYSSIFLLPFYLIQGRGYNPAQAGFYLTAQPIVMAMIAPISGTLSDKIGTRIPTTFGMAIIAIGLFFLSRIGPLTPILYLIIDLAILGLGIGIFISPNNSALMGSAPRHRQGIAAGLSATSRNVGMVLGIGLAGAIFTTVLGSNNSDVSSTALYPAIKYSYIATVLVAVLGIYTSTIKNN
jgi:EmrB/QacA subfamily drug resistance transporter